MIEFPERISLLFPATRSRVEIACTTTPSSVDANGCGHAPSSPVIVLFSGSKEAKVNSVDVSPCDNPSRCTLKKGTKPKISATFTTSQFPFEFFAPDFAAVFDRLANDI